MSVQNDPLMLRGRALAVDGGPFLFGVLNVTPDSFSDGGDFLDRDHAIEAGLRLAKDGADVIDVGGESTRPGSAPVPDDEQIARTVPVIVELCRRLGTNGPTISIDTRSAAVASAAMDVGAVMINDVSAGRDDAGMIPLAAERRAGMILMHMLGTPTTMQTNPTYEDVIGDIKGLLSERISAATSAGIPRDRLIVDPGIGFGKTTAHNLDILRNLSAFRDLDVPVMIGPSRKRFLGELLNIDDPKQRDPATAGIVAACVMAGVECVRVHNVAACRSVADICAKIRAKG